MNKPTRTSLATADKAPIAAHVDPYAPTAANRTRASALRTSAKRGTILNADDAAWLAGYEEARGEVAERKVRGASAARKVTYTEEESASEGEGMSEVAEAAVMANAAGFQAREEGRRYDSLLNIGVTALREAVNVYRDVAKQILDRNRALELAHVEMMNAHAKQYFATVDAEGELRRMQKEGQQEKDPLSQLAEMLVPMVLQGMQGPAAPPTEKAGG